MCEKTNRRAHLLPSSAARARTLASSIARHFSSLAYRNVLCIRHTSDASETP